MPARIRIATVALTVLFAGCAAESASEQPSVAATASPTPAPGTFGAADLPRIVLSEEHLEPGWTLDELTNGFSALVQPIALLEPEYTVFAEQPGFVDARMTRIGTTGQGSYWEVGGYVTWVVVYEAEGDAEGAFEVLIAEHESERGWGMERTGRPPQGEEGVTLEGAAYGRDENLLNVWRNDNLLLAAGAFGVTANRDDTVEQVASITEAMDARANESP